MNDLQRFRNKVTRNAEGCWIWNSRTSGNGYGRFKVGAVENSAHRWAYERFIGSIPSGMNLDHLCRIRACVNPRHLEAVTPSENIRRGMGPALSAERQRAKTQCRQGHPYDEANTYTYSSGKRGCRQCRKAWQQSYEQKRACQRYGYAGWGQ